MKSELGSMDLKEMCGTDCMLVNKWGLGLLSVHQDDGADPFVWWSMVNLLGLWGHAGMERHEKYSEQNTCRHVQTHKYK